MKYGFCASMVATDHHGVGLDLILPAKQAGFDYIELPVAQAMTLEEADFHALERTLTGVGLPCLVCNNLFPADLPLTGMGQDMGRIEAYCDKALARAARLGAKTVVLGSPAARQVPAGFDRRQAWRQLEQVLALLCARAELYGISVAVEPICVQQSNIINTVDEAAQLCAGAGADNAGPMGEFYHLRQQGDSLSRLAAHGGEIRHVHIANSADHSYPAQAGEDSYGAFLEVLCRAGYDGTVSIEGELAGPFVPAAKQALVLLRGLEQQIKKSI